MNQHEYIKPKGWNYEYCPKCSLIKSTWGNPNIEQITYYQYKDNAENHQWIYLNVDKEPSCDEMIIKSIIE